MLMSWKNAQRGKVVEAGTYLVEVKDWKDYIAQSGNPCVIVEMVVVKSGSEGESDNNAVGQKISDFLTLTENSAWKLAWFVGTWYFYR